MKNLVPENIITALDSNLVSYYHYQIDTNNLIPVFVLQKMDFTVFDTIKADFEKKQFIILTQDDITSGNDIFPLKFLHMQQNSTLVQGIDSLSSLIIQKNLLRLNIEFELRNKLIQLRESYLSFEGKKEFLLYILPVMLMIWNWVLFLHDKTATTSYQDLKILLKELIQSDEQIFDALIDPSQLDDSQVTPLIQKISEYLEWLTKQIDQIIL